ncbi:MAG: aspartate carbamoyltransferase regulatory subunit [Lachnospiraceae bacterium]|jgi:aspartate carbamoyltransferase regulatory subunit|nr:aspartate carbamoyltransferase regulatory subunit [Lachnospiraceae bacterium]
MLNISGVNEGYVLDHIKAGTALKVYHDLGLEQHDYTVAIIMNVKSNKMGKKDILKIECPIGSIDLDVLGFIDHNITVNIVKNGFIADKLKLKLPKEVHNVIRCKNPRCISTIEQELEQVFILTDPEHEVYRCKYCEEKYERK